LRDSLKVGEVLRIYETFLAILFCPPSVILKRFGVKRVVPDSVCFHVSNLDFSPQVSSLFRVGAEKNNSFTTTMCTVTDGKLAQKHTGNALRAANSNARRE